VGGGYGGDYYGGGDYYNDPGQPQVVYVPQQPQQQSPQVVINQGFMPETARPIVREYTQDASGGIQVYAPPSSNTAAASTAPDEDPLYLIALRNHTIYAARAYWLEGDTLHYITGKNSHNQVSLNLVDRELSDRLNRERDVEFRLPATR